MAQRSLLPFRRTRAVQIQIDEFLDLLTEAALVFEKAGHRYIDKGLDEEVTELFQKLRELETRGDELQRSVEHVLFSEMLIPQARGDVLGLLDDLDHLLDSMKKRTLSLSIERQVIPDDYREDTRALVTAVARCVDSTVMASRAYFRDPATVRDHIKKIEFHESESDRIAIRIRQRIFDSDMKLQHKLYLRDAIIDLDTIADDAEDAGDRLAIYAVKRSL